MSQSIERDRKDLVEQVVLDAARQAFASLEKIGKADERRFQRLLDNKNEIADWVALILERRLAHIWEEPDPHAQLIYGSQNIVVGASSGMETFAAYPEEFKLRSPWYQGPIPETPPTPSDAVEVEVHEMFKSSESTEKIFRGFGVPLEKMCLTESQVVLFIKNHRNWLVKERAVNIFLLRRGKDFWTVYVTGFEWKPIGEAGPVEIEQKPGVSGLGFRVEDDCFFPRHRIIVRKSARTSS